VEVVFSEVAPRIHRGFIAIHTMEGVRAKTRKEEYKREQPGYVLLRGGERRWA
jgi:hypothetical protein